ncbi:MarR family winged helix-turn-helix transcriptional regulator [Dermacoccaceae bacterium W4C1]
MLALAFEARSLVAELNAALTEVFRPLGLTCVQAEALLALKEVEPVSLKGLSEHLVAESGHPSRLVSRLVADGFIERKASTDDGRAVLLTLTPRGVEAAQAADEARAPLVAAVARERAARLPDATEALRAVRAVLADR